MFDTKEDRKKMVLAMEFIARHVNDEDIFIDYWLSEGVADGDINYGDFNNDAVDEYYIEDDNYESLKICFSLMIRQAIKSGGLMWCYTGK